MSACTRVAVLLLCCIAVDAAGAEGPRRRALLIGINDYTASRIPAAARPEAPERDWPDLLGAVHDVEILREMLVLLHGFDRRDIVTLTDQAATRAAILQSIERHLVVPAAKDDILFFYFAGHGSQVRNSRSDERDQLDESIVPADSRLGAPDIRDKELRRLFNRILDRGARLTVMLDACNSGSGARGLASGARARGVRADLRDVRDATDYGPRPERRGAIVLSAAQDFGRAWEMRDAEGKMHGAFSWAWIRALRDASAGEPVSETFLRADARMRAEMPHQEPVIAGLPSVQSAPFLGGRASRHGDRTVVAVEKVRPDGTLVLEGGWAHGLSPGTELRDRASGARAVVTALLGLGRSEARLKGDRTTRSGALMEVVAWALPPGRPLRVWVPRMPDTAATRIALARRLAAAASRHAIRWTDDPTESTPTHLLRWGGSAWELIGPDGGRTHLATAEAGLATIPPGSSLFVQFPAPSGIATEDLAVVARAEDADYVLAGRYARGKLSYAWVRPAMRNADRRRSALPIRTAWVSSAAALNDAVPRLRRLHAWQTLHSPPGTPPYGLAVKRDGAFVRDGTLAGGERYEVVLRATSAAARPRYVYAFVIDSHGAGTLLFPRDGSVENRFSGGGDVILATVEVAPPYGIDTYVLLTTEEPLPNPWILSWEGVRAGLGTVAAWSIERVIFESIPPRRH